MKKLAIILPVMMFFLSACATQSVAEMPPTPHPTQSPLPTQTVPPTPVPPTSTPQPTPTAIPVRFDQNGYRNFSYLSDHFSGLDDYTNGKNYSTISSSVSPDGSSFAISACWGSIWTNGDCETRKSGFLIVIDANSGELISDIPLGSFWPGTTAFTPDGSKLLFSTDEHKILLWDLHTNTLSKTLLDVPTDGSATYPDIAVAPDNSSMAAVVNQTLYVWRSNGELVFSIPAYQSTFKAGLTYNPDGSLLAAFSQDRSGISVYQTSDGTLVHQFPLDYIWDIAFSPDGRMLAGFSSYNYIYDIAVWDIQSEEKLVEFVPGNLADSIVFSPDSSLLLVTGSPNVEVEDDHSKIAEIYETHTWAHLDDLRAFGLPGKIRFNQDGSKFFLTSDYSISIWGEPDAQLLTGLEQLKQFQLALSEGDYEKAATFFMVDEYEKEYLTKAGVDLNDLPGSFERLCQSQTIYCYPVKELVMMGHDWAYLTYLVRLADPSGEPFTSPKGAQIFYLHMKPDENGLPLLFTLPQDD